MSSGNRGNGELSELRVVLVDHKSDCLHDALSLLERASVKIDPVYAVHGDIRDFIWRMKLRGVR